MRSFWGVVLVGFGVAAAVGACNPPNVAGEPLKGMTTGEAFAGVKCSAVRPQTEPDLMAWDPGSRSNLNRLRREGVVAVRYEAKGCDVELELLSNCIGTSSKYAFSPYSANERKVAHNANELFAQLPVGAVRLAASVKGTRALRTDYMLAGQYALTAGSTLNRSDLRGPDCERATHVINAIYVGGFAMAAGESRQMDGAATIFGVGAGAKSEAGVEVLGDEGDATACSASQRDAKEDVRCAVPLRIGLVPLGAAPAPAGPTHECTEQADCHEQCARGNLPSCYLEAEDLARPETTRAAREPLFKPLFQKACDGGIAAACSSMATSCHSLTPDEQQRLLERACELKEAWSCIDAAGFYLDESNPRSKVDVGRATGFMRQAFESDKSDLGIKGLVEDFLKAPADFIRYAKGFYCARPKSTGVLSICSNSMRECACWRSAAKKDSYDPRLIYTDSPIIHHACAAQRSAWCYGDGRQGAMRWNCFSSATECKASSPSRPLSEAAKCKEFTGRP